MQNIKGLSNKEALELLNKFGPNSIEGIVKKQNHFLLFLKEFKDPMILLLITASLIAIINDELIDGIVIFSIVFLNAIISFFQQFKAEKALDALKQLTAPNAKVIRNGQATLIKATEVVPNDIMLIESGDRIAADGEIIENNDLYTQESVLTGESTPVEKTIKQKVFMGTEVSHGFATILVKKTGIDTEFGRIAHLTQTTEKVESPLQKEIRNIGVLVTKLTIGIASILFTIGWLLQGKALIDNLIFAVSVAVAAVPEGLPATITIALALGVQRLAKKKAIIKQLASAETLGSTSCIITDKTGTLTRNEMTAQKIVTNSSIYKIEGIGYEPIGSISCNNQNATPTKQLEIIKLTSIYCGSTKISKNGNKFDVLGDPTEAALLTLAAKMEFQKINEFKVIKTNPFDSQRKMMSVKIQQGQENYLLVKGAPESVLDKCTHYLDNNNNQIELTAETKKNILEENNRMANEALRVIAIAYHNDNNVNEDKLIYVGLIGILDPPREEVKEVIVTTQTAGLQIIVATGDNGNTAGSIAISLGIIESKDQVLTHDDIEKKNDVELQQLLCNNKNFVFARVTPEDKLRLVKAQQNNNKVVAMTGDGVNDAPALKQADIGIAMGITGTEVSKEAANMVLTDDQFTTIISAIREGRNVYHNLKKIVFYLFSSNIGELVIIFTALILNLPTPLTAILILLINIGTDALPAIALSTDQNERDLLNQPPRSKSARILEKHYLVHVVSIGIFIGLISFGTYLSVLYTNNWRWGEQITNLIHTKAITATFVSLIIIQFFNAFNASSLDISIFKLKLHQKKLLILSTLLTLPIVYAITVLPIFQTIFKTTNLAPKTWLIISLLAILIIPINEIYKLIVKPKYD